MWNDLTKHLKNTKNFLVLVQNKNLLDDLLIIQKQPLRFTLQHT
jgi:hypothetical protein